jgi:hypothetical protein
VAPARRSGDVPVEVPLPGVLIADRLARLAKADERGTAMPRGSRGRQSGGSQSALLIVPPVTEPTG